MDADYNELAQQALWTLQSGNLAGALAVTDQLVAARRNDPAVRLWRAEVLLRLGDAGAARTEAQLAVKFAPVLAEAQWLLALADAGLGRRADAQAAFERALELSQRSPAILHDYARFMLQNRGPKLAEAAAVQLVVVRPESSDAWAILGAARLGIMNYAGAEQALKRALQLDPDNSWAKGNLAYLMKRTGRPSAADALMNLLQDDPPTAMTEWMNTRKKDQQTAQKLWERKDFVEAAFQNRWDLSSRLFVWGILLSFVAMVLFLAISTGSPIFLCLLAGIGVRWFFRWLADR